MFRADLHCHTNCSDGTLSPEELVRLAAEIGLSGLSITDHDTVEQYALALPVAQELGIELIPGAEFSALLGTDDHVHLLGYAFDPANEELLAFCRRHVERRNSRNAEILRRLASKGMKVTEEEMMAQGGSKEGKEVYGRPHIAQAMVDKGYVSSVREAFDRWIGDRKPCFASGKEATVEETIDMIHQAGGIAVIAHPHVIRDERVTDKLLSLPFDGIEGHYSRFYPHQERRWIEAGKKRNWIVTGGSDFHGSVKPETPLGCSWVNEETFRKILVNTC